MELWKRCCPFGVTLDSTTDVIVPLCGHRLPDLGLGRTRSSVVSVERTFTSTLPPGAANVPLSVESACPFSVRSAVRMPLSVMSSLRSIVKVLVPLGVSAVTVPFTVVNVWIDATFGPNADNTVPAASRRMKLRVNVTPLIVTVGHVKTPLEKAHALALAEADGIAPNEITPADVPIADAVAALPSDMSFSSVVRSDPGSSGPVGESLQLATSSTAAKSSERRPSELGRMEPPGYGDTFSLVYSPGEGKGERLLPGLALPNELRDPHLRHLSGPHAHSLRPRAHTVASRALRRVERFVGPNFHLFGEVLPALRKQGPVPVRGNHAHDDGEADLLVVHDEHVVA